MFGLCARPWVVAKRVGPLLDVYAVRRSFVLNQSTYYNEGLPISLHHIWCTIPLRLRWRRLGFSAALETSQLRRGESCTSVMITMG